MKNKTKLIITIAALLVAGRLYYTHEQERKERERVEWVRLQLDMNDRAAAARRKAQEEVDSFIHQRPALPPPPAHNPQLDELNRNLEKINQSIQEADVQRSIEAALQPWK